MSGGNLIFIIDNHNSGTLLETAVVMGGRRVTAFTSYRFTLAAAVDCVDSVDSTVHQPRWVSTEWFGNTRCDRR